MMTLSSIELCAGAGGSALGLEQAGFHHKALIDNNIHACNTLLHNRPNWNVIEADLKEVNFSNWKGVDLVSGGLPCPPFSIAGKQLGSDDERDLFPTLLRAVNETLPRAILVENVRGILTSRFDDFRAGVDLNLSELGYNTYWAGFNAVEFGVPQNRFRAFLIALKKGETKPLKWPIPVKSKSKSVGETIFDLMAKNGWEGVNEWALKADQPAPTIVGGSHKHGGPDLGPTRARNEWAKLGVDGKGIANDSPEKDFEGMPRLTVPMVSRLQTFPDDWFITGVKTNAYKQVGNALPVKLSFAIGKALYKCLD